MKGGGIADAHLTPVGNLDWPADHCGQFSLVGPSSLVSLSSLAVKFTEVTDSSYIIAISDMRYMRQVAIAYSVSRFCLYRQQGFVSPPL